MAAVACTAARPVVATRAVVCAKQQAGIVRWAHMADWGLQGALRRPAGAPTACTSLMLPPPFA